LDLAPAWKRLEISATRCRDRLDAPKRMNGWLFHQLAAARSNQNWRYRLIQDDELLAAADFGPAVHSAGDR
jgi:hypothetical protein